MADYSDDCKFVEGQAILAAQAQDMDEVRRLLDTMLISEREELAQAASRLAYTCLGVNIEKLMRGESDVR